LRPDLGEGVRLSVSGNYVILYVMHPDLMENPDGNPARGTRRPQPHRHRLSLKPKLIAQRSVSVLCPTQ